MLELSSALYLGFQHAQHQLPHWRQLTTGQPAALSELPQARNIGHAIARLQGLEAGLVGPSTLHLFWDLFGMLDKRRFAILMDSHLYPVGQSGVERARGKGLAALSFRHLSPASLREALEKRTPYGKRPVVVTDGWCPRCGKPAPLPAYLKLIRPFNGLLVVDDTQALGVLGSQPSELMPYGIGGGGILKWWQVNGPDILSISSLAKAFGVPLAAICGSLELLHRFERKSTTRISSSPASNAHLAAAQRALQLNRSQGNARRESLLHNVLFLRKEMAKAGWPLTGGMFPVQALPCPNRRTAFRLYRQLEKAGIRSALVAPHLDGRIALLFLLRAGHRPSELAQLAHYLRKCTGEGEI